MAWYNPFSWTGESASTKAQRSDLDETGLASNQFAEYLQGGAQQLGQEAQATRDYLRNVAQGGQSISQEQLRQGLQAQLAAQRSMAAGAPAGSAPMAARNAAMNMNRAATGMSGQAALAGLQERRDAQNALAQMIMQQRGQDMQGALGSRGNAISAYGAIKPEGSALEKYLPLINAGVSAYGASKTGGK